MEVQGMEDDRNVFEKRVVLVVAAEFPNGIVTEYSGLPDAYKQTQEARPESEEQ